jgi:hypothetical protein
MVPRNHFFGSSHRDRGFHAFVAKKRCATKHGRLSAVSGQGRIVKRISSERVPLQMQRSATFALLPSSVSSVAQSRKERMEAAARTQVSEAESPAATEALPERFMAPSQTAKWNHTGEQSRQNPLPGEDHSE